jgi:uncharacterized protein (TIGR02246 family)
MVSIPRRASGVAFALLLSAAALAGCKQNVLTAKAATEGDAESIRTAEAAWSQEMAQKNPDKFAAHYAPDAVVYVSGAPLMRGRDAVKAGISEAFKDPNFALSFSPEQVVVANGGDIAYATGSYTGTGTDPKTKKPHTVKGTYLTVYRKETDGTWAVTADFAGELPSEAMAKPKA